MKQYIQFKAYLHKYLKNLGSNSSAESGISFLEIIATVFISTLILNFAFKGFSDYRQTYLRDQVTNDVNQRIRSVFGMVGPDIKQTGEGLISDPNFPAIVVSKVNVPNTSPVETTYEIIIRRGIIDTPLPICQNISAGTNSAVMVMDDSPSANPGCELFDNDDDGWPDVVKQWRDKRLSDGGTVRGYIYDGVGNGEFFDYNGEITKDSSNADMTPAAGSPATTPYRVSLDNSSHTWANTYTPNPSSRIYLIEERRYRLELDPTDPELNNFQVVIDDNETLDLVAGIDQLSIKANVKQEESGTTYECDVIPPSVSTDCTPNLADVTSYSWAQIQSIEITVTALPADTLSQNASDYISSSDLELTEKFFPRNVFSF